MVKLKEIKNKRKALRHLQFVEKKQIDPFTILEDRLDNAKRELVYWFNKSLDNEKKIKQLEQNLQRMTQARTDYEYMLKQERQQTNELTKQLTIMRDLLS
mgnify:FL=1